MTITLLDFVVEGTHESSTLSHDIEPREKYLQGHQTPHLTQTHSLGSHHYQPTSLDSIGELSKSGERKRRIQAYLDLLCAHPEGLTDIEAARKLGMPASSVSARRNDVIKLSRDIGRHLVINVHGERRQNPSGKSALVWRVRL